MRVSGEVTFNHDFYTAIAAVTPILVLTASIQTVIGNVQDQIINIIMNLAWPFLKRSQNPSGGWRTFIAWLSTALLFLTVVLVPTSVVTMAIVALHWRSDLGWFDWVMVADVVFLFVFNLQAIMSAYVDAAKKETETRQSR
jgi:hypothetical protein